MPRDPGRFKGLLTNVDPKDVPPGYFYEQRNLGNFRPGRLDVRPGMHTVTDLLSNIAAADTEEKIGVFSHSAPHATWLVGHRTDGAVKAHRNLSGGTAVLVPTSELFDTNYPCCFVRDGLDGLLIFNGLERGYRWDGVYKGSTASAFHAGVESPEDVGATVSQPPTLANNTGVSNKLTPSKPYIAGYRYRDYLGYVSNLSELASLTSHANGYAQAWSALLPSSQGVDGTQYRAKYIELFRSVADAPDKLYLVARIGNRGVIVSATGNATTTTLTLQAGHNLIVGAVVTITGVSGLTTLTIATLPTPTTVTGLSSYNSTDSDGGFWTTTGYNPDSLTDDQLLDRSGDDVLPLFNDDDTIFARSFGLPPDDKPFFASFQGVMFAYGRVNYSVGVASGTAAGTTITLSGGAQVKAEWVSRVFIVSSTGEKYVIQSVTEGSNTFTIDRGLPLTLTSVLYVITPDQTRANLLCYSRPGYQESFLETDAIRVQQPSDATDRETGLLQFGAYLYILHEYHIYQVTFNSDPRYDGQVSLAGYRGAVNNRSCAVDHGTGYIFDQKGGYTISGPCCPTDISSVYIRNIFQGTIDWSTAKKKWYFASIDPSYRVVRYHVNYVGDTTTYPMRAVCYNTQTNEWWEEEYPLPVCGASEYEINGRMRLVLAGPDDRFLVCGDLGTGDGVMATLASNVTSLVTGTLTVTTAVFASTMVGYPVRVVSGPGAGSYATISAYTSTTVVTVTGASSGFSSVTTESVIVLGSIAGYCKTGMMEILPPMSQEEGSKAAIAVPRQIAYTYDPTVDNARLAASLYLNNQSAAIQSQSNYESRGVKIERGGTTYVFSSKKSLVPRGEEPGRKIIPLDSVASPQTRSDLFLSARLDVVQGIDQLSIRAIEIEGFG